MNETLDNLRHLVVSTSAREIGIIKKEHVINIIDSVVQRSTISMEDGAPEIKIKDSIVHRVEAKGDEERKRREEERLGKEKEERRQEEEVKSLQRMTVEKEKKRQVVTNQEFVQRKPMAFNIGVSISAGMGFDTIGYGIGISTIISFILLNFLRHKL